MNNDPPHQDWLDESNLDIDEAVGLPDPDPAFRARLLERTTARIRRRRHTRLLAQAAALLVAFTGGMVTTLFFDRAPAQQSPTQLVTENEPDTEPPGSLPTAPEQAIVTAAAPEFSAQLLADPEALTFRYNEATPEERLRLLRAAGDHYFYMEHDLNLAADFYRRYIEGLGENADFLFIDTTNWLFASISTALQEDSQNDTQS